MPRGARAASRAAACLGPSDAGRARRARLRGRVPTLLVLLLCLLALGWLVERLTRSTAAAGFTAIDTRRVSLEGPSWVPPAWEDWMGVRIAERRALSSLDPAGVRELVERVAAMPQVLAVRESRVDWPDGLTLELELRRPVACIRSGGEFLGVAADGIVLPGYWKSPPDTGAGHLPVIGPNDGSFDRVVPGDALAEERHLDALSVALSLWAHLPSTDRAELGPVLIDASRASSASVNEPGTRLYLEHRRLALFGRPPRAGMPGELPERAKWLGLSRALAAARATPPLDWDLVDLRWDRARIRPRGEEE